MNPLNLKLRRSLVWWVCACGLALGACASNKGTLPMAEFDKARASITQAETAGAGQSAPLELLTARDKFARAQAAGRNEDYEQARRMAEQASADADLAAVKARAVKAQEAARELARANATLEQEVGIPKDAK
jgi:hypothetical protein